MEPLIVLLTLLAILLILIFIGVPIVVSLAISTTVSMIVFIDMDLMFIAQNIHGALDNYALLAIPYFILASNIIVEAGISRRLLNCAEVFTSGMRGGLGIAGVLACAVFAAISGSSAATVIAIGTILIPGMVAAGYNKKFATAMISCAGSLGVLIPPSVLFIIYGVLADESIGKLFAAGMVPGIILTLGFIIYTYIYSVIHKYPKPPALPLKDRVITLIKTTPSLLVPIFILGGIYSGIVTPTEAAAVGVFLGLFVGLFVYRELDYKKLPSIILRSAEMSSMILLILAFAYSFAWIVEFYSIPSWLSSSLIEAGVGPLLFLLILNIVLILAGQFLDPGSIILIFTPMLVSVGTALGIDTVHLGVVIVINMELGLISPPVGFNLYVGSALSGYDLYDLMKPAIPIMIMMFIVLLIITYIPSLSLWLPNLIFN